MNSSSIKPLVFGTTTFIISLSIARSFSIALATFLVILTLTLISGRRAIRQNSFELLNALPEVIDSVISGIQSGLSLNESLSALSDRGPVATRLLFKDFKDSLESGRRFEDAVIEIQRRFGLRTSDQLFEALLFAKSLGGSELITMLRQLGDFTRQDLALRSEIAAKQSWIRNSAHLSAAAPWILLLLLSTQPATAEAFSQSSGITVLALGVAMTVVAYLWMGYLGRMPEPQRIFGGK
jgi:tight adherence protein B